MNCTCCGEEMVDIIEGHESTFFCVNNDCPYYDPPVKEEHWSLNEADWD